MGAEEKEETNIFPNEMSDGGRWLGAVVFRIFWMNHRGPAGGGDPSGGPRAPAPGFSSLWSEPWAPWAFTSQTEGRAWAMTAPPRGQSPGPLPDLTGVGRRWDFSRGLWLSGPTPAWCWWPLLGRPCVGCWRWSPSPPTFYPSLHRLPGSHCLGCIRSRARFCAEVLLSLFQ